MRNGGLSKARLGRLRDVMAAYVEHGEVPGIVTLVSRQGEVHVDAIGTKALGGSDPIRRDTIFRFVDDQTCHGRGGDDPGGGMQAAAGRTSGSPAARTRQSPSLKRLDGPLDDTVPATRPITVRDLLTFRMGFGIVMAPPGTYPIQKAMDELLFDIQWSEGLRSRPSGTRAP